MSEDTHTLSTPGDARTAHSLKGAAGTAAAAALKASARAVESLARAARLDPSARELESLKRELARCAAYVQTARLRARERAADGAGRPTPPGRRSDEAPITD